MYPPPRVTVLLIDPHKEDRESFAQRLTMRSAEYLVIQVETGTQGLAACRSQRIDCVVTELNLPDMSGFELLVRLVPRALQPAMPVLVLSSLNLPPMERLLKNNGAQAYLNKSVATDVDLDLAIRKAIAVVGPNKSRMP